ncbi:MAG: PH domain-containing protein [Pirellulaceae bacterium]
MNTEPFDPRKIDRPDNSLFQYYLLVAALTGPLSVLVILPLWFRYSTLRYKFDDEGVSMRWGMFFRREVNLTYRRIQDIHLTKNPLQRWMGLAKISLQTASGSANAEMAIEGILEAEALRDFLYSRMRGARGDTESLDVNRLAGGVTEGLHPTTPATRAVSPDRVVQTLTEIRDALATMVESKTGGRDDS